MTQYGFYFDSTRCTGCKTCEMACKDYKDLPATIAFRKVYDYEGGSWTDAGDGIYTTDTFAYHVSLACNHCAMPACMAKCPSGAIEKDGKTGLVHIDQEKCTGVGACVETCPYNVPIVDKALGKGVKCDGCADRVAEGLNPICVDACPVQRVLSKKNPNVMSGPLPCSPARTLLERASRPSIPEAAAPGRERRGRFFREVRGPAAASDAGPRGNGAVTRGRS